MTYRQIASEETYGLSLLRKQGLSQAAISRVLGRDRSTISRKVRRNRWREDGQCFASKLEELDARVRRRHSRRNSQFSGAERATVESVSKPMRTTAGLPKPLQLHGTFLIADLKEMRH